MTAIGLLTIGQSPRFDLSGPLRALRPDCQLIEAGALDHLSAAELPISAGRYPLKTRLRDGSHVTVDLDVLEPLLQQALQRLETQDVVATLILCAGTFANLVGAGPLIRPFGLVQGMLRAAGIGRIGVICPFEEQEEAIRARWLEARFDARVSTVALVDTSGLDRLVSAWTSGMSPIECIVLDYVGHDPAQVERLQKQCNVPVFDLGLTAMTTLAVIMPKDNEIYP